MKTENRTWDLLVRIFHWGLVIAFSISYFTGEEESSIHIYSGYSVLALISFRIIWGIIGSTHARFSDFVRGKDAVISYLKSLLAKNPQHYQGHNPAGGWMVIALIISLFASTLSGLKLYAVEEGLGPFANSSPEIQLISSAYADDHDDAKEHSKADSEDEYGEESSEEFWEEFREEFREEFWEEFWEEVHEISVNFTLLLIFIHISGVLVSSVVHKENFIKAMITGNKKTVTKE